MAPLLRLKNNSLTRPIPESLANMLSLRRLALANNQFDVRPDPAGTRQPRRPRGLGPRREQAPQHAPALHVQFVVVEGLPRGREPTTC